MADTKASSVNSQNDYKVIIVENKDMAEVFEAFYRGVEEIENVKYSNIGVAYDAFDNDGHVLSTFCAIEKFPGNKDEDLYNNVCNWFCNKTKNHWDFIDGNIEVWLTTGDDFIQSDFCDGFCGECFREEIR